MATAHRVRRPAQTACSGDAASPTLLCFRAPDLISPYAGADLEPTPSDNRDHWCHRHRRVVVLAVTTWTKGEQIAGIVSAVCGVLAVGAAVVPLLSRPEGSERNHRWWVVRTGRVRAGKDSTAITGASAFGDVLPDSVDLLRTGRITVGDESVAITGLQTAGSHARKEAAPQSATVGPTSPRDIESQMDVERSGQVRAGDNSTNVTGVVGSLTIARPADVPRPRHTDYLVRVRQLRPETLRGRELEVAELAEFCSCADGPAYVWWQAGPWAGKTALMAHFVDNPPAAVRIVSFFVIARDAAEADSDAFLEVVIPQLAEIAELPVPSTVAGNRKRDFFWELVEKADAACAGRGERLVLLVDGLDEDRSLTVPGSARSIASILPKQAGRSFRVIVAGRQNPPIPADVQADHPLRDPAIVRLLAPSPHGLAIRAQAELQLRAHLDDGGLQHEVLAFVTVARGGLTVSDLAELTGETVPRVRDVLDSHSGRAYQLRNQVWSTAEEVMLAHDKLREAAQEGIAPAEWNKKLAALARWAASYRDRGWRADSPEYLLTGLQRVLLEVGDVAGLVAHVADLDRLELLRSVTGGDAAGLGQVNAAIEHVGSDSANAELIVRLALVRDHLSDRNGNLPQEVPEVWVRLGEPRRAEALAESSIDPSTRSDALGLLIKPLIECGYGNRVGRVIEKARAAATLADAEVPWSSSYRLILADRLQAAGFRDEAVDLLHRVYESDQVRDIRSAVMALDLLELVAPDDAVHRDATVTEVLATRFDTMERIEVVDEIASVRLLRHDPRTVADLVTSAIVEAISIPQPIYHFDVFRRLANFAASAGRVASAVALLDRIQALARSLPKVWNRIDALRAAAILACDLDDAQAARSFALEARDLIDSTAEPAPGQQRQMMLRQLAGTLGRAHAAEEALATADRATDPDRRHELLASIATVLVEVGQINTANRILGQLPDATDTANAHLAMAQHHASAGRFWAADVALAAVTDPSRRARALGSSALYAIGHDDTDRARTIAVEAENIARGILPRQRAIRVLCALGVAHHQLGDAVRAHTAVAAGLQEAHRTVSNLEQGTWASLCRAAVALAETGQQEVAQSVAAEVVDLAAERLSSGRLLFVETSEIIQGLAPMGSSVRRRMSALLTAIPPHNRNGQWFASVAYVAYQYLDPATASRVLDMAVERLKSSSADEERARVSVGIAATSMRLGRTEQAYEHLVAAIGIADTLSPGSRRSILDQALYNMGGMDEGRAYEAVIGHVDPSDYEYLCLSLAGALGELGRLDEAGRYREEFTGETRRDFVEHFADGLVRGGLSAEAMAEYHLAEDAETSQRLIVVAVRAQMARNEIVTAVQLATRCPVTSELRNMLPDLLEQCDTDQARAVASICAIHDPVSDIADHLASTLPEILVANEDVIRRIYRDNGELHN